MNKFVAGGYGEIGFVTALLNAARMADAKLPPEERERRRREREADKQERIRRGQILANICPVCDGKLARGKKNKRNDYKRDWNCGKCGKTHSL